MTAQSIYIAILILIIIVTIVINSLFFLTNVLKSYIVPIISLVITSLYIFLPTIYYLDTDKKESILKKQYYKQFIKIYISLILIILSIIAILGSIYADDSNKKKLIISIEIMFYILCSLLGLGIIGLGINNLKNLKKNKVDKEPEFDNILKTKWVFQIKPSPSIFKNNNEIILPNN